MLETIKLGTNKCILAHLKMLLKNYSFINQTYMIYKQDFALNNL